MVALGPVEIAGPATIRRIASRPTAWAAAGFAVHVLAMYVGELFALNADDHTAAAPNDPAVQALHRPEMGIGLIGAVIAVLVARRALSGPAADLDKFALGLAIVATASIVIFWAGWPTISAQSPSALP